MDTGKANKRQEEAITHTEGPLLIVAGPGSGKTFTLVERVIYLLDKKKAGPENLLVLTFTDKAAAELRTRISNRLIETGTRFNINEMYIGTFHSICLRLLDAFRDFTRLKRNYTIMDQFDQQFFLFQRLNDYAAVPNIEEITGNGSAWERSRSLCRWINKVSEEAIDPENLKAAQNEQVRALGVAYDLFRRQLEDENALDFSTIQYETLKLLRAHPKVTEELRARFRYVMVDEYQDTNTIQEMILSELCLGDKPNLCVVGDDDQGLYRFRGASIRNIIEFKQKFPDQACRSVPLETNYRSHPEIISLYNHWMSEQDWELEGKSFRLDKTIHPENRNFVEAPTVLKIRSTSPRQDDYNREVLEFLMTLRDKGQLKDWNQVAFLFYSVKHDNVVSLARYLEKNGIPVYSPRSNMFFDREEIRLMIGALIFLFPQFAQIRKWEPDAHLEIWDYYDESCFRPFGEELRKPENSSLRRWIVPKAKDHKELTENTDYAFTGLFYQLLQFPLFSRFLGDGSTGNVIESRAARNLANLSKLLGKFEYLLHVSVLQPNRLDKLLRNLFNQYFRYLKDGGINEYEDDSEYAPSGCVSFLTIHQSKGLEFPVVIVGSLEKSPRKNYTELDEIIERDYLSRPPFEPLELTKFYDFRRLYYTAFSRAQNVLALTCRESRNKNGSLRYPTKYFVEAWDRALDWRHNRFRPDLLSLESVKDVNLKREYSFTSHITLYENCPEQYRFFRELEFAPIRTSPILFGTLVHQTIEDIHKTVLRGEEGRVNEDQIKSWFDINYAALTKRERVYLVDYVRKAALEQVLRYYRRERGDWSRLREAEVDVSLVKENYILSGTVDLIRGDSETVEIVDFKSEKKPDIHADREKLDRYRRQLEVYAHLVEERTGLKVSRTHLYYTSVENGNPYISFKKDHESINQTIAAFDSIVQRIEKKDFNFKERPKKLCENCDMRFYCDGREMGNGYTQPAA